MKTLFVFCLVLFMLAGKAQVSAEAPPADSLLSNFSFTLYPNPARESLTIQFSGECAGKKKLFEIYNPLDIIKGSWLIDGNSFTVDLKDIWPDFYYVQVTIAPYIKRKKFLREF